MTLLEIITSAMRLVGVLEAGEIPDAAEAQLGKTVTGNMLSAWSIERLMTFTISIAEYSLTVGQQTYTLGPGGNFNAPRPPKIESASIIILSNPGQPLELEIPYLTDKQWQNVPVKNIPTTVPLYVYDDGGFPLRSLSYWGIPTAAISTKIYSWTALSQFTNLTQDLQFPPGYDEAIRYNLAVRLAPEFQEVASQDVKDLAVESKARIKSINIPIVDLRCDSALTGSGANYDYRSDTIVGSGR